MERGIFEVPRTEKSGGDADVRTSNCHAVDSLLSWRCGQGDREASLRFIQHVKICLFDPPNLR